MTDIALPQHMTALAKANMVRSQRAVVKAQIACGERRVADVLDYPCVQSMMLEDLLLAQPSWGRQKVTDLLRDQRLKCSAWRRVGDLTPRQRERLAELLA